MTNSRIRDIYVYIMLFSLSGSSKFKRVENLCVFYFYRCPKEVEVAVAVDVEKLGKKLFEKILF